MTMRPSLKATFTAGVFPVLAACSTAPKMVAYPVDALQRQVAENVEMSAGRELYEVNPEIMPDWDRERIAVRRQKASVACGGYLEGKLKASETSSALGAFVSEVSRRDGSITSISYSYGYEKQNGQEKRLLGPVVDLPKDEQDQLFSVWFSEMEKGTKSTVHGVEGAHFLPADEAERMLEEMLFCAATLQDDYKARGMEQELINMLARVVVHAKRVGANVPSDENLEARFPGLPAAVNARLEAKQAALSAPALEAN